MSEPEKIRDVPKPPVKDRAGEPSAPKTSQSAFDKVLEQSRLIQQNPLAQGKVAEQGASDHRVKEVSRRQDGGEERRRDDDKRETREPEKARQKEKGSETVTREAVVKVGERKGFGGGKGGGGRDKGGFGSEHGKKQLNIISKKIADARGLLSSIGQNAFAGRLAQARAQALNLTPQQMQAIVNQIVQSVRIGKNELGSPELRLILRDHIFAGLRLRFTSRHGKVTIHFETANSKVRDLFKAEGGKIRAALEEKGIAVSEIKIV